MTTTQQYRMTISDPDGGVAAADLLVPFLAYPGLNILCEGGTWHVDRVMVVLPRPGSQAAQDGETIVDVQASPV